MMRDYKRSIFFFFFEPTHTIPHLIMEEKPTPWGSWSTSDMEMEERLCHTNPFDEEFLRDILQQQQEAPATTRSSAKKPRSASESQDHIMSERNRRQELTRKFIALAATIPGLKKMDKAHVLREAINYVKQLEERVQELEQDIQKNGVESAITITRSHLCIAIHDHDTTNVPEVEARVLGKELLIKIHCAKQKGILLQIMSQLERLHLYISTSNVLPFGNTLDITIIAQMGDKYKLVVKDLVKELRQVTMMKVM